MEKTPVILQDFLGNSVSFPAAFLGDLDTKCREKLFAAVQKPAIVISEDQSQPHQMHYYRSAEWQETLLLTTQSTNGHWEAARFQRNPSTDILAALIRKGEQLL